MSGELPMSLAEVNLLNQYRPLFDRIGMPPVATSIDLLDSYYRWVVLGYLYRMGVTVAPNTQRTVLVELACGIWEAEQRKRGAADGPTGGPAGM